MASSFQKLRSLALEALVAIGVFVLLIAISEGLARIFLPTAPARPTAAEPAMENLPRLHRTEDLAQPGVRGLNAGALYEANRSGFRGPDRVLDKPRGVSRIAVIGDSTAMGWGVEEEDTYAARLDRLLNPGPGDPRIEVLNFGLAGLNIEEIVRRLENRALPYEPNIVIYGYALNDIKGPHYRSSLDPEYLESLFRNDSGSRLWQLVQPTWLAVRERMLTPPGTFAYELDDNYFRNPKAWSAVQKQIEKLAALGSENDFCTVFLAQAQLQSLNFLHSYRRHYKAVTEVADQNGLHVVDSMDRLEGKDASELWVSELDRHANAEGHALFAEILAEALAQLPAECWEAGASFPKTRPQTPR